MLRRVTLVSVCAFAIAFVSLAGDGDVDSTPRLLVMRIHAANHKESDAVGKGLTRIRTQFEEKEVLFIDIDTTSKGSRHQASLLLNALGLGDVRKASLKAPGKVVVVDLSTGRAVKTYSSTDLAKCSADLDGLLKPAEEEMEEDEGDTELEEEDDSGCDGCGCDE